VRAFSLLLAVLCLGTPSAARAQIGTVFNRTGSGARAAGMANAFIAVSDDGTAASWNPAGLGQLRKPEISVVTTTGGSSFDARSFRTLDDASVFSPLHSSYGTSYLDFASLAVPVTLAGKATTFQASWRRMYTLDYRENVMATREPLTPDGPPPLRLRSNSDVAGGVDLVSIAAALKLTRRLALGGALNLWRGSWQQNEDVHGGPIDDSEPPRFLTTEETNRLSGDNLSLGVLLTYTRWSLGILYLTPVDGDVHSTRRVATSAAAPIEGAGDGTLRFGRSFGVGAAWRPAPAWTVALDLTSDDWNGTTVDSGGGSVNLFDGLPPDRTSTRDTLSVNAGAERLFSGEGFLVPLRFGMAWEPQGPRSPYTRDPVNFVMMAVGTGYNTNSIKFDAAVQYRWASFMDGANFTVDPVDGALPLAVGERTVKEWRVKVSLIVRVTDTEKLRGWLGKIFGDS
jgi:hypothetical protein